MCFFNFGELPVGPLCFSVSPPFTHVWSVFWIWIRWSLYIRTFTFLSFLDVDFLSQLVFLWIICRLQRPLVSFLFYVPP